jgi:uncharacterized membrane protein YfcA
MTPIAHLRHQAETRLKNVALIAGQEIWTYQRLTSEAERLGQALVTRGVRQGDRVALHMANLPEMAIAYFACFQVGAIACPLNDRLKAAELQPLLQRLQPVLYIGQSQFYPEVADVAHSRVRQSFHRRWHRRRRRPVMIPAIGTALLSGSIVGFSLGLVGGGGSILATPLLLYLVGMAQPHLAIGTSALAVSANAYANLIGHARSGNVRWRCAAVFALIGTLGALAGSTLGKFVEGEHLLLLFGLLMLLVGATMLRPRQQTATVERPADLRTCTITGVIAFATGFASGFFGIGGGFLIVPALVCATGMPIIKAIGSSLLAVGSFGLATAINYALAGLVDWVVAGEFIAGGIGGGVLGMALANRLSTQKNALNRIFAILIFAVAAYVLYRSGQFRRPQSIRNNHARTPSLIERIAHQPLRARP